MNTPERLRNYANIIENENHRLKQQVERVLQVARLDKEDVGFKKEPCDIHALIREAVENNTVALAAKQGKVKLELNAADSLLNIDKLHFTNVIYNLIDNAVKYTENKPEVSISTQDRGSNLEIAVADNGIGIKTENQKRVFHRFYRVPTGNVHDVQGFGLG